MPGAAIPGTVQNLPARSTGGLSSITVATGEAMEGSGPTLAEKATEMKVLPKPVADILAKAGLPVDEVERVFRVGKGVYTVWYQLASDVPNAMLRADFSAVSGLFNKAVADSATWIRTGMGPKPVADAPLVVPAPSRFLATMDVLGIPVAAAYGAGQVALSVYQNFYGLLTSVPKAVFEGRFGDVGPLISEAFRKSAAAIAGYPVAQAASVQAKVAALTAAWNPVVIGAKELAAVQAAELAAKDEKAKREKLTELKGALDPLRTAADVANVEKARARDKAAAAKKAAEAATGEAKAAAEAKAKAAKQKFAEAQEKASKAAKSLTEAAAKVKKAGADLKAAEAKTAEAKKVIAVAREVDSLKAATPAELEKRRTTMQAELVAAAIKTAEAQERSTALAAIHAEAEKALDRGVERANAAAAAMHGATTAAARADAMKKFDVAAEELSRLYDDMRKKMVEAATARKEFERLNGEASTLSNRLAVLDKIGKKDERRTQSGLSTFSGAPNADWLVGYPVLPAPEEPAVIGGGGQPGTVSEAENKPVVKPEEATENKLEVRAPKRAVPVTAASTAAPAGAPAANIGAVAENSGAPAGTSGAPADAGGAPAGNGGASAGTSGAPADDGGVSAASNSSSGGSVPAASAGSTASAEPEADSEASSAA
ncbi:hypothetical protein GCM10027289_19730 [Tsukamurella serpentis]